ncbi:efflux RND transporter periplasmic adaptor subunit [Qipengyuania sp.]|uniref:efflux RND transporter periplasmic adaptor subunit n=1 Tax=Qipengyuania sp. TaxID=2004515 RepID=UPI0035C86084
MLSVLKSRAGALLLPLALVLSACAGGDAERSREGGPKEVGYVVLQPRDVAAPTTLGGRVVAQETSEVRPQISGLVRSINFRPGGYVRAGQPLFRIDPSLYNAAASQARANLASAQANAAAATSRAERLKPLAEMEAVSQQDYDDAAAAARAARAAVAQQQASLETARINLRFTTVPAPISGRIGRPLVTEGALVSSNQPDPLAVIQRTDSVYVDMRQSAADLVRLRQELASGNAAAGSTRVRLKLDDGSTYGATGTVEFSEVTVSEDTGTVTLRARFPNPDGLLLPGMFVNAIFDQVVEKGAYLVPQAALQRDFNGQGYVFLVGKDGTAIRRAVTAERTSGQYWVVTEGLTPGVKVIVQGLDQLKSGAKIKPVPASAPQPVGAPKADGEGKPAALAG